MVPDGIALAPIGSRCCYGACPAGSSPVLIAVAATGQDAGFAFVITTVTTAGAGTGPALPGVGGLARTAALVRAPVSVLRAPAYSDLFPRLAVIIAAPVIVGGGSDARRRSPHHAPAGRPRGVLDPRPRRPTGGPGRPPVRDLRAHGARGVAGAATRRGEGGVGDLWAGGVGAA